MRFHFVPGAGQALEANRYFRSLGEDLLAMHLHQDTPKQLLFTDNGRAPLPLRVWSKVELAYDQQQNRLTWIRNVLAGMRLLSERPADEEAAVPIAKEWLAHRHGEESFFMEVLQKDHAFSDHEKTDISIGVLGGETVMLSADNVMFVKLEADLYGLSVARVGSYLIENVAVADHAPQFMRRA